MSRTLLAAAVITLAFAAPVVAMDNSDQSGGQAVSVEQRKADILKRMDQRIADFQENRNCVQAAQTNDDLKTCRDKEQAVMESRRKAMGMQGGPGQGTPTGR